MTKDYPLTVRFIELMPFDAHQIWKTGKFISAKQIIDSLKQLFPDIK
ncbi:MAG TPA: cyclic pyranopterin phosphate synthase MoaA, partial [Candidatus Marinimicrobia bacterium]|nr:cyclic pyranopterin phosphate synthase MoaA [Candidatus Neomarinimicrobiota bacterium]